MNNKEQLIDALIQVLKGQPNTKASKDEDTKKQLAKIIENYVKEDNLERFGRIFVSATTEEELFEILRELVRQYYHFS